jgi:hypothetical protein
VKDDQLTVVDAALRVLGEAEQEQREIARSERDHDAITAPPPLPFPSDALLDEPAAEIGIDQPSRRPLNGFDEVLLGNILIAGKTGEGLQSAYAHRPSLVQ